MAKFDSKSFNPQAFGAYVNRIPNTTKTELAKSGAVGNDEQAKEALSTQTGSLYARVRSLAGYLALHHRIMMALQILNRQSTTTYEQGVRSSIQNGFLD